MAPVPHGSGLGPVALSGVLIAVALAGVAVVAGALAGLITGRRRGPGPGSVSLRGLALLLPGAACVLAGRWAGGLALLIAGHALLLAFAVANWRHPGMVLAGAGLLANLVVITVNGGMPVTGVAPGSAGGGYHGLTSADHLTGLADVIRLSPFGVTISPGDVLVTVGGALAGFAYAAAGTRRRRPARTV